MHIVKDHTTEGCVAQDIAVPMSESFVNPTSTLACSKLHLSIYFLDRIFVGLSCQKTIVVHPFIELDKIKLKIPN